MSLDFEDRSGQPPSALEIDEAVAVVQKWMVIGMMQLPPELAVQLPNIRRCLLELKKTK